MFVRWHVIVTSFRHNEAWFAQQLQDLVHHEKILYLPTCSWKRCRKNNGKHMRSATRCHIYEKPFTSEYTRVHDYCHLTGRCGPAQIAILIIKIIYFDRFLQFIGLWFIRLRTQFIAHFIIKEIAYDGHVDVLPITKENYISFTKHVKETIERAEINKITVHRFI